MSQTYDGMTEDRVCVVCESHVVCWLVLNLLHGFQVPRQGHGGQRILKLSLCLLIVGHGVRTLM
jgi:hypothetical protein